MSTKDILEQIRLSDMEISRKLLRLEELYADATAGSSVLGRTPGGGQNSRAFEERINRYMALRDEINAQIDALADLKTEIRAAIDALPDVRCRMVLELHYLHGMTYDQIAKKLGYDPRHVMRLAVKGRAMMSTA